MFKPNDMWLEKNTCVVRFFVRTLVLIVGALSPVAFALPDDQQQPIHVTANSAVQENNTVTYRGNVIIVQGSVRIEADQVVIQHEKGKLQKATATGKPARFQQQPDVDGGLITGSANTLIYHNSDQRVELLQDALVDRDKSTVKSDRIEYLLPTKTVRADSSPSNTSGRVEMILQPNQPKSGDASATTSPTPTPPAPGSPSTTTPPAQPTQPSSAKP
ncbi:MAG: lipopolysaccharide transport periplasmic protein LptA [Spongiibacteraceae bacterium]